MISLIPRLGRGAVLTLHQDEKERFLIPTYDQNLWPMFQLNAPDVTSQNGSKSKLTSKNLPCSILKFQGTSKLNKVPETG